MFQNSSGMQGFGTGFNEGGFQTGAGGFGSPSGGVDKPKKYRFQNITPVTAQHVQQMTNDGSVFSLGGNDISQITIVGTIIGIEKSQTCTTYKVDDTTGFVTVKDWSSFDLNDDQMENGFSKKIHEEGTPVRVFAQVRSFQMSIGGGGFSAQNNSNIGFNQSNAMNMGMDSTQAQVWRLIESCQDQIGMSINDIKTTLKNLNVNQIKKALDFLSNEGHIYSTIDEDHFRSTS